MNELKAFGPTDDIDIFDDIDLFQINKLKFGGASNGANRFFVTQIFTELNSAKFSDAKRC